jgi:hypothetical protein
MVLLTLHNKVQTLYDTCKTATSAKLNMQEKRQLFVQLEGVFMQNNDLMREKGQKELRIPLHAKKPAPDTMRCLTCLSLKCQEDEWRQKGYMVRWANSAGKKGKGSEDRVYEYLVIGEQSIVDVKRSYPALIRGTCS